MTIDVDPGWHARYFGRDWLRIALGDHGLDTVREADFVMTALRLTPQLRVLDIACGHGRHAVELARRGVRVTGVDSSPESIELATERAREEGLESLVGFQLGDMRALAVEQPYDAAILMKTSFGFMATEQEDQRILESVRRALVPNGALLIDLPNVFRLARTMVVPRRWQRLADGTVHIEDRTYDFRTARRNVRVELLTPAGQHLVMSHSVRVYALHELDAMLAAAGYRLVEAYGGYAGEPVSFETKRLIVRAVRTD